uniref:Secreted protein n=1 Tax=Mandrillus leucophaeus TaxID=9568 RepID=A0A2K5YLB8_MANLE
MGRTRVCSWLYLSRACALTTSMCCLLASVHPVDSLMARLILINICWVPTTAQSLEIIVKSSPLPQLLVCLLNTLVLCCTERTSVHMPAKLSFRWGDSNIYRSTNI